MFKLIQPLLNHSTLDKMKIFNSNKEEWLPALLEEISADEIPAHYGGSLTDPDGDPKCPGKVNYMMYFHVVRFKCFHAF